MLLLLSVTVSGDIGGFKKTFLLRFTVVSVLFQFTVHCTAWVILNVMGTLHGSLSYHLGILPLNSETSDWLRVLKVWSSLRGWRHFWQTKLTCVVAVDNFPEVSMRDVAILFWCPHFLRLSFFALSRPVRCTRKITISIAKTTEERTENTSAKLKRTHQPKFWKQLPK